MNNFNGSRKVFTQTTTVNASPEKVFLLLCPVMEYKWIQGWTCEMIYTDSGVIEKNCIFITNFDGIGRETWHVSEYIPNEHICFIRISNDLSIRFDIDLFKQSDNTTEMRWTHIFTSTSDRGNELLMRMSPEAFSSSVILRGQQLDCYINTGLMMK